MSKDKPPIAAVLDVEDGVQAVTEASEKKDEDKYKSEPTEKVTLGHYIVCHVRYRCECGLIGTAYFFLRHST